jgi:hypothetical protein
VSDDRVERYVVHGIVIESQFEVDLLRGSVSADTELYNTAADFALIRATRGTIPPPPRFRLKFGEVQFCGTEEGTWLRGVCGSVAFVQHDDSTAIILPNCDIREPIFQHSLTSFFLPSALALSGHMMFHCACISIDNATILVGGSSGAGKSTTSAGLRARGHRVLSDDITRVTSVDVTLRAHPSYPTIRLREPSVFLPEIVNVVPTTEAVAGRHHWPLAASKQSATEPLPIAGFIHLSRARSKARLVHLGNSEKVQQLISNVFLTGVSTKAMIAHQFPPIIAAAPQLGAARLSFRHCAKEFPLVLDAVEGFARTLQTK